MKALVRRLLDPRINVNTWLCEPDLASELSRAESALGGSVHHRVKEEEVVVRTAGAWGLFRGSFNFLRP